LMARVLTILDRHEYQYRLLRRYTPIEPKPWDLPDWAYRHQRELVRNALHYCRCIQQAPTGSGKTKAAAWFLKHFPEHKCLVIVPYSNLQANMARELEDILQEEIGLIGGRHNKPKRVTVGIINSLEKHAEGNLKEFLSQQDVLVIDEAHQAATAGYQKVSKACINTSYRLGLTATFDRKDGAEMIAEGILGPLVYAVPEEELVRSNVILKPKVMFCPIPDPKIKYRGARECSDYQGSIYYIYPTLNGKPDRQDVYLKGIIQNEARNRLAMVIARHFIEAPRPKGSCLVLFNEEQQGRTLSNIANEFGLVHQLVNFRVTGEARQGILDAFRAGEFPLLIASNVLNMGEDVPKLELIVNAAGGSNLVNTVQRLGRGVRVDRTNLKTQSLFVDFMDEERYYLRAAAKKRQSYIEERYPGCTEVLELKDLLTRIEGVPIGATP
jgi:superfamily II DNA or RNA helicase